MLTVTNDARTHLVKMLDQMEVKHFRVKVEGGGCSGFQYSFDIVEKPEPDDILINFDTGYFVVMDPTTVTLMEGAEIDWKKENFGSALIIRNPNATQCCGCGNSFSA